MRLVNNKNHMYTTIAIQQITSISVEFWMKHSLTTHYQQQTSVTASEKSNQIARISTECVRVCVCVYAVCAVWYDLLLSTVNKNPKYSICDTDKWVGYDFHCVLHRITGVYFVRGLSGVLFRGKYEISNKKIVQIFLQ